MVNDLFTHCSIVVMTEACLFFLSSFHS